MQNIGQRPFTIQTPWLTRALIVLLVLVAAVAMSVQPKAIYLAIPFGVAGLALLLARPQLGYLALIAGSLIIPFGIGTGSESKLHAGMLILGGLLAMWGLEALLKRYKPLRRIDEPTTLPLLLFLGTVILAFSAGQLLWFPQVTAAPIRAQLGGVGIFLLSAGAYFLAANRITKVSWLNHMVWLFMLIGIGYVFAQFVPRLTTITDYLFERTASGATGSIFWVWLAAFIASQGLVNKQLPLLIRLLLLSTLAPLLYFCVVMNREWTSGWLPTILAIGLVIWQAFPRWRVPMFAGGGALMAFRLFQSLQKYVLTDSNSYSLDTRVAAWSTLWQMIKINPIFGFGPSNYYFYTPLFPILGYRVNFNSHNNYIDLVAQLGFLGLIAFLWFAWRSVRYVGGVSARMPAHGFAQAYATAAYAGWVATLVAGLLGDWFLPFVYNLGFVGTRSSLLAWLFVGGVIALDRLVLPGKPHTPLLLPGASQPPRYVAPYNPSPSARNSGLPQPRPAISKAGPRQLPPSARPD